MKFGFDRYAYRGMVATLSIVVSVGLISGAGCGEMTEYTNGSATLNIDVVGSDDINLIVIKGIDEEEGDEFTMWLNGLSRDYERSELRLSSAELSLGPGLPNIVSLRDIFESDISIRFIVRDNANTVSAATCTILTDGNGTDCRTTFSTARDLGDAVSDIESIFDATFDVEISGTRAASFAPDDTASLQLGMVFTHLYRD